MTNLIELVQEQLCAAGYEVAVGEDTDGPFIMFESAVILGFVLCFPNAAALIEGWQPTSQRVIKQAQLALRRAEAKSWNAYLVLLAVTPGDYGQNVKLGTIEEDLVGTRKIARAGIINAQDTREAMLPLFAVQNAPRLATVDMSAEIRLRTSELPKELVDAFLGGATEATLTQLLETGQ